MGEYLHNKYLGWYRQIVERAAERVLESGYERHHVRPRSLGGSNHPRNIVKLTYREHFLVHWLLVKFTQGEDKIRMSFALTSMTFSYLRNEKIISGWQYELAHKARSSGQTKEGRRKISEARLGIKFSDEHKQKIGVMGQGRKHSLETRDKMSKVTRGSDNGFWGKKHDEETRQKMRGPKKRVRKARRRIRELTPVELEAPSLVNRNDLIRLDHKENFQTLRELGEKYKLSLSRISQICRVVRL